MKTEHILTRFLTYTICEHKERIVKLLGYGVICYTAIVTGIMGHRSKDVEQDGPTAYMKHYTPFPMALHTLPLMVFALNKHWDRVRKIGIKVSRRGLSINYKGKGKEIERKYCGRQLQAVIFRQPNIDPV